MAPIRKKDGTPVKLTGYQKIRKGDGEVLFLDAYESFDNNVLKSLSQEEFNEVEELYVNKGRVNIDTVEG